MHPISKTALRGRFAAVLLGLAACAEAAPETPMAPADAGATTVSVAALPVVDLRLMMDTITTGIIADSTHEYNQPWSTAMTRFRQAIDSVHAGKLAVADALLDPYHYDVYRVQEAETGDTLVVFRERLYLAGKVRLGWGTYIYNAGHDAPVDIHVNHPISDQHTEDIGIELYRDGSYRWFLVAGAERDAIPVHLTSDVAHYPTTMFSTVSTKVRSPDVRAISIHGFRADKHAFPAGVDQVISNGVGPEYSEAFTDLEARLDSAGSVAGLFGTPGYASLGGTTNRQGISWRNTAGPDRWMHLEIERDVRLNATAWRAMNGTIRAWVAANPL